MSFESEYLELRKKRKKKEEEKKTTSSNSFQNEYLKLREQRIQRDQKEEKPSSYKEEDIAPFKRTEAKSFNESVNKVSSDKVTVASKGAAKDTKIDRNQLTKRLDALKKERDDIKKWLKNPVYNQVSEESLKQETTPEARKRAIDDNYTRQYKNQELVLRDIEYEIQDINDLLGNRTWFRKPEVGRDGYQEGEFTKGVLASATDLVENVAEVIIGGGEKVVDTLATLAPYIAQADIDDTGGRDIAAVMNPEIYEERDKQIKAGAEELKGEMAEFAEKDLYNEEAIAKAIISNPIKKATGIDAEADSVFGEKSDALVQSAGQLGLSAGLQAVGIPWWVTMGAYTFGSQSEQALTEGATLDEAALSATISTGAELLSEKLSGGISFGGKTLDDLALDPLMNAISNKALKTLIKLGADATGEGLEEIFSGVVSNLGTALYKEENLKDILLSEKALDEYLEGFIGGIVLGGGSSTGNAIITTSKGGDYVAELTKAQKNIVDRITKDTIKKMEANGEKLTTTKKNEVRNKVVKDVKEKIEAYNKDRDSKTGLNKNEQAVFDKVYNDTIAEKEADGTKLSKAEKKKIYDATMKALERGTIDTDTIESVLGGEEYTNYKSVKDQMESLQKEYEGNINSTESAEKRAKEIYNALKNKRPGKHTIRGYKINVEGTNLTIETPNGDTISETLGDGSFVSNEALWREVADIVVDIEGHADIAPAFDRQAELETQIGELKGKSTELRGLLDTKMRGLVKDSMLTESYAENIRRKQSFQLGADIKSYSNKHVRETLENFVNHFESNNTREAHDYVDFLTKIAEDRNHSFDFMTTAQIEKSIKNGNPYDIDVEDASKIEAFVSSDKRTIIINMDANKSLSSLVGHETTHTLEKLGGYDNLQEALFQYAKTKGEYEDRLKSIQRRYKNLGEDGQKKELTADLLGDYVFSDPEFIKNLSMERPNIFKRILNEIKYFCKMATTGSRELRELERVKHLMEKTWQETAEVREFADTETKLSIREEAPPKETGIAYKVFYVKDGKLYPPMVANPEGADTPMGVWLNADVGTAAPPSKTGRMQVKAGGKGTQGGSGSLAFRPGWHLGDLPRASQFDRVNLETGKKELFPENFVWAEVEYAKDVDYQEEAMSYGYTENGKFRHSYAGLPRLPENGYYRYRTNPNPDTVPWVITGAMKVNRLLSDAEVNTILEENGVQPVHRQGGDVGLDKFGFSEDGSVKYSIADSDGNKLTEGQQEFFKDSKVRDSKGRLTPVYHGTTTNFNIFKKGDVGYHFGTKGAARGRVGYGKNVEIKECYINITNPIIFNEDLGSWDADYRLTKELYAMGILSRDDVETVLLTDSKLYKRRTEDANKKLADILLSKGYDGIEYQNTFETKKPTKSYIAFSSNQIKLTTNTAPTSNPDIRYSIAETDNAYLEAVNRGDTETAQRMVDEVAKKAGYTIKAYHGTNADFTVFDKNRVGKGIDQYGAGFYFASNADVTEAYGKNRYDTYLNIKKPINLISKSDGSGKTLFDVHITQAQAYKILKQHPLMYDAENSPLGDFYEEYWNVGAKEWMVRDLAKKYNSIGLLDSDVILFRDYPNELHEAIRDVLGYDGVRVYFETDAMVDERNDYYYVAWFDNQMKSSDPITYDNDGNVIPLSERFNEQNNDIRYSIATEYESLPKTTNTMTPTAANLKRNTASVRDVRGETMRKNNYTETDVKQINDFMDNMASFMEKAGVKYNYIGLDDVKNAKLKVVYDKQGNPKRITMSAMVANGDYPVNFDFTSICKKRQSMSMVIKELASRKDANGNRVLDTVNLDANALWKINEELRKAGLETACLGCFVESKRYNVQNFANKAVKMWNSIVDEVRAEQGKSSPVGSFSFAEGIDLDKVNYDEVDQIFKAYTQVKGRTSPEARMRALITNGGEMYQKYLQPSDIMTPEGIEGLKSLSTKKNNLYGIIKGVYGQAAPKEVMGFSPYNSEVALLPNKKNGKPIAEYIASIGGVRMQSFSDFVVSNVYDYMQMVADLSARHLPAHAYTKEISFAKIFGLTGIKINMSVMFDIDPTLPDEYAGLKFVPDINGDEEYNGVKGRFEYLVGDKKRSDEVYKETGDRPYVQSIGFDEAVELQNTEGYSKNIGIIGVGFSDKHIIKMLGDNNIRYVIPYHASSLPSVIMGVSNLKKAKDYTDSQNTRTKDGESLAGLGGFDIYKDVAKTQNPKETADNYLWYCVNKGYTPIFDQFTWHENYYKLLFDFDPYDTITGEYSPQTEVSNVYKGYNPTEGNFLTAEVEQIIDDEMKTQNEANEVRNEKLPDVVDNVLEQLGIQSDRVGFSLAYDDEYTPEEYGYFNTYAKDLAIEKDIAPTRETKRFATDYSPLTEAEANVRDSKQAESHYFLDDIAPEAEEMYNGNYADHVKPSDPFYEKDIWEVGKDRKAKAYMYEHPEVKPFFQEEARYMLGELDNSHKGEKFYNDQLYYDTNGEMGIFGTKRHTSEDIAYLLDSFNYTYKDIAKGLKAIIEDNGKENNAISKRIEFLLDERLRNGYTDFWFGDKIPPNQEYINLLNSKQITEYNDESWNNWLRGLSDDDINQYFSAKKSVDVSSNYYAPTTEQTAPKNANEIAPTKEAPLYEDANGQQAMFETKKPKAKQPTTRKKLHENIINDLKSSFTVLGYDFDEVLKNAKNLSTFATVDNTPQRVMEKALGYEQGQALADLTVNKVAQNETEGIKWLNSFTDRKNGLLAQISKQYHIKPGSKESAAAQMYAEGFYVDEKENIIQYGDQELAKDFPDIRTQLNIKGLAGDERIRRIYDDTLARINESRTRNAYPEIPRLDNYFLHFRAMEDTFSRLGLPFNPNDIRAKDLPTDLNGVTADLKPGQPYFASANHRTGKRTSFDLLGGLEKYLTSAKNQIYHIDDIQTLRALRNYIADTYGQANGLEGIDALSEEEAQERIEKVYGSHLSTFAKFLNEEANVLAGKTALIDRGLEGIIGRRGITFLDTLNRQVGSNMVGYSASSAIVNLDALPRAIAKLNKFDVVKAFAQYTSNKINSVFGRGDDFADQNPVIIRRKGADRFYRNFWQNISDKGYFAMGVVDDFTTEIIARAKYNELTRKGMDSQKAHFETDKWVSKLMGDRSLGQMPQIFNSKMLGMITKFQLEVRNNLDSQFYDTIQEAKVSNKDIQNGLARNAKTAAKVTSTLVQLAIGQHLFGKAFESIAGYNPSFDIVSALLTAFGYDDDEDSEDDVLDNVGQAFLGLLEDMPYSSVITGGGRIPISSALPSYEQFEQLVTGEDEYGNEKSRLGTLGGVVSDIAPYYFMPGGFGQLKKTIKGLSMFDDDLPISGSYTDSGNLRFPVEDTIGNRIQAGLFGQWASKNARDYFDNEYAPLKAKQIDEFIDVDLPYKDYQEYRQGLSGKTKLNEKGDYIANLDMPTRKKNILINNIADRDKPIDLTDYDKYADFEEFDFATRYPEKYKVLQEQGISVSDYKKYYEETAFMHTDDYSWAADNAEKYTLSKAITSDVKKYKQYTSELNDIKADKDAKGNSISGSAKKKKAAYINSLDLDYGQKAILYRSYFDSKEDKKLYNRDILDYLNSRNDLTYEEKIAILKELDFKVYSDGRVEW